MTDDVFKALADPTRGQDDTCGDLIQIHQQ
jgi:hypothetical protein